VSGVQERLFDSFKLEDNFPASHLLRRSDRFLDLSNLRQQYLPDFCNHTCRPLLESALMIRVRFAGCCFAIRSDRFATSEKLAGRDGSADDAVVEREALATNQPFRQARLVAAGRAASFAMWSRPSWSKRADRGRNTGQRHATRLSPGLKQSCLNGSLRRNRADDRCISTILNVCISLAYDIPHIDYFNLEGEGRRALFVVNRGYENGFFVVVAGVILGGRLRRDSLDGDARRLAGHGRGCAVADCA
jgi:hypothetical protein